MKTLIGSKITEAEVEEAGALAAILLDRENSLSERERRIRDERKLTAGMRSFLARHVCTRCWGHGAFHGRDEFGWTDNTPVCNVCHGTGRPEGYGHE